MNRLSELKRKFRSAWPHLDERTRRIMAGAEAASLGYGGISLVRRACGLSRKAIAKGIREIQSGNRPVVGRIRQPGAGRKSITQSDPGLVQALETLIEDQTRGDQNRRCAGFVKARGPLPGNWASGNIRLVI